MNIHEKLKTIIAEIAKPNVDITKINNDTILTNDLGFDSIQIVSLIIEIETQFDIEIDDEDLDMEKLTIYKTLHDIVLTKINH